MRAPPTRPPLLRIYCPLDGLAPQEHVGLFFSAPDYFLGMQKAGSWSIVAGNGLHKILLDREECLWGALGK